MSTLPSSARPSGASRLALSRALALAVARARLLTCETSAPAVARKHMVRWTSRRSTEDRLREYARHGPVVHRATNNVNEHNSLGSSGKHFITFFSKRRSCAVGLKHMTKPDVSIIVYLRPWIHIAMCLRVLRDALVSQSRGLWLEQSMKTRFKNVICWNTSKGAKLY